MWTFQSYFLDLTIPYEDEHGQFVRFKNGLYSTANEALAERLRKHKDVIDLTTVIAQAKDEAEVEKKLAEEGKPKFRRGVKHVGGQRTSTNSKEQV